MCRFLTLDAALASCSAGLVDGGRVIAARFDAGGQAALLPLLAHQVLEETGGVFDAVVVTVGPGSFTGLRAALALAHGVGLAAEVPVLGVTVGAAMSYRAPAGRRLWTAIDNKRGRVYLERDGAVTSVALTALPQADGAVAVAGDAAIAVASRLAARNADVHLLDGRRPCPLGIALAAMRGETRPAQPLYVDPPAVRPGPAGRPAPA
jgi:tRNA threonylcarbamoyladenosine biosynthesis protein TsaB